MADDDVVVRLVGGPADWAGRELTMPRGERGAYLISAHTPERGEGEDINPRAVYEPDDGSEGGPGDGAVVWRFRGWFPASVSDPSPEDYEREAMLERGHRRVMAANREDLAALRRASPRPGEAPPTIL